MNANAWYRPKLTHALTVYFDESELRSLCYELDVDYEELSGANKQIKAIELVAFCERRGRLPELAAACHRLRPNVQEVVELRSLPDESVQQRGTLAAKLSPANREEAFLLAKMASARMTPLGYQTQVTNAFQRVFDELVENGWEYGTDRRQKLDVSVDVNGEFTTLTVINANRRSFDLAEILQAKRAEIRQNPWSSKGRGLLLSSELADALESVADSQGVKACFYRETVVFRIETVERLLIVEISSGLYNPSINRRLHNEIEARPDFESLIIHVPRDTNTKAMGLWLDLYAVLRSRGQRMSVFLGEGWRGYFGVSLLPRELVSYSWEEALLKVWKGRLRSHVAELCRVGRLEAS